MANRFPLIANSSANQIQELAAGDNLDLTSSGISNVGNINSTGIITATTILTSGNIGIGTVNPSEANLEIYGNTDGVVNLKTSSNNGTFIRYHQGSQVPLRTGCSAGFINGSRTIDAGIQAGTGTMFLASESREFRFIPNNVTGGGGIDIVLGGPPSSFDASPFIRFYDAPTGQYPGISGIVHDANWAIGVDDTDISSFKIAYGGGDGSTKINTFTGVSAALEITSDEYTKLNLFCSEITDTSGSYNISGTGNLKIIDKTSGSRLSRGSYLVQASIQYRGSATGGDQDECVVRLSVNGNEVTRSNMFIQDSNYIQYEDYATFTYAFHVNGSQDMYVDIFTTNPEDPGGADVNYEARLVRLGG